MPLCLNPQCAKLHPDGTRFCCSCGTRLLLQDRYTALKMIGQGGFGKTFLAEDLAKPSRPRCVIKQFIPNGQGSLHKAVELFQQEAVRLDELGHHPQIPALLSRCEQDDRQYIIQEFIDGQNLAEVLEQEGPFSEHRIRQLLLALLPVLQVIHQADVIHRDIKPENIILGHGDDPTRVTATQRKLFLVDFGAAKHATHTALIKTGTTIGSAGYAAPEQGLGHAIFASDLYGLGVTCLHLLTQTDPFTLYSPLESKFVWRSFLNGNLVSHSLGRILDQLTAQRVPDRYQSASEVLQALLPTDKKHKLTQTQPAFAAVQPSSQGFTEDLGKVLGLSYPVLLEMVTIPAGSFVMGSNDYNGEQPPHLVQVPTFHLGKYPITQAQYEIVMGNNPAKFAGADRPVETVSWEEAQAFCEKLSQKTGRTYLLPTEAEWEYACRAGSTTRYYFGNDEGLLRDHAWYVDNSEMESHPVGQKRPNAWGIYDMHGNVWEWCADDWHNSYVHKPEALKQQGSMVWSASNQALKVLRGGAWFNIGWVCRSADRNWGQQDQRNDHFGFRVACCRQE